MNTSRITLDTQLSQLDQYIEEASRSLKSKPTGNLACYHRGSGFEYYHISKKGSTHGSYISKKQIELARELAQKDYDQRFLTAARKLEGRLISLKEEGIAEKSTIFYQPLASVYSDLSEARQKLVSPYVLPDELFIQNWESVKYSGNPHEFAVHTIFSEKGEKMRSKSEKIIADKLYHLHIPYRYEYPLILADGSTIYPDFSILNVQDRRVVIMEHHGMMQNEKYARKALSIIDQYTLNGFEVGYDVIHTFESDDIPLNTISLEIIIRQNFL